MSVDLTRCPIPLTYRELWLPRAINNNTTLPTSIEGGHELALTGAQKGSTVDGLEMRGAERITITDHADIHINDSLTVVLPAFILPTLFDNTAGADMGLMNLNNGSVIARLNSTTGALDFIFDDADGGADETVSTTKVSWAAGTLWQVAFTFKFAPAGTISVRLYINGVAENTNDQCDQVLTVPAGNTVFGEDLTTFFTGKLQGMILIYDTAVLAAADILEVYKGIPYDTNLQAYIQMDHPGRGVTMLDRSTGGNCSGTISGAAIGAEIWDFGQVEQPVLSFDGHNDYARSSVGLDISGAVTVVWVGKMKSTYDSLTNDPWFYVFRVTDNDTMYLFYNSSPNSIMFSTFGGGTREDCEYSGKPSIDDYLIFIGTAESPGIQNLFVNGLLVDSQPSAAVRSAAAARADIGARYDGSLNDPSKPLMVALIDGAFTQAQALAYSRYLKNVFNLPITI